MELQDLRCFMAVAHQPSFTHSLAPMLERASEMGVNVLEISDENMTLDLAIACRENDERPTVREFLHIARNLARKKPARAETGAESEGARAGDALCFDVTARIPTPENSSRVHDLR